MSEYINRNIFTPDRVAATAAFIVHVNNQRSQPGRPFLSEYVATTAEAAAQSFIAGLPPRTSFSEIYQRERLPVITQLVPVITHDFYQVEQAAASEEHLGVNGAFLEGLALEAMDDPEKINSILAEFSDEEAKIIADELKTIKELEQAINPDLAAPPTNEAVLFESEPTPAAIAKDILISLAQFNFPVSRESACAAFPEIRNIILKDDSLRTRGASGHMMMSEKQVLEALIRNRFNGMGKVQIKSAFAQARVMMEGGE